MQVAGGIRLGKSTSTVISWQPKKRDMVAPSSTWHLQKPHGKLFGCASCIRHREWKDTSAGETQVWLGLVAGRPREVLGAGEFIVMGDLIAPRG
jgi:hypothetical protein